MIKKSYADIPAAAVDRPGFRGMTARFALTAADGMPHYALRVMEFEPGGYTSLHGHAEEHEFYFLEGEPSIVGEDGKETRLAPGDVVYTAPHELHQIRNVGTGIMRMVCTIPILEGGDGKTTTQRTCGGKV